MRTGRIYPDAIVRPLTRPWLVLATAVAVVALPAAASGALSAPSAPTAVAANSTTYQDSTGENPAAPDITTITVSNTDAGTLSFRINIPNRPQYSTRTSAVDLDSTPMQTTTGDPQTFGADFFIAARPGRDQSVQVGRIRLHASSRRSLGTDPTSWSSGSTVRIYAAGARQHEEVHVLSSTSSRDARSIPYDWRSTARTAIDDSRPADAGLYPYDVKLTQPTLVVKSLKPTPAKPTAGCRSRSARRGAVGHRSRRAERPGDVSSVALGRRG